jgi:hypothetical protein
LARGKYGGTWEEWASRIFIQKIEDCKLCDLEPTWRNNIIGADGITKRLDSFLLAGKVIKETERARSWVGEGGISNHIPIFLQIDKV